MSTNEIIRRRALSSSGTAIDWESIARGMLDCTTEFSVPDSIQLNTNVSMFASRKGLLRFSFPSGVTTVASSLCYGCSKLSEVEFPNTITRINQTAFQSTGLTSVTIPSSVTRIDAQAFAQCKKLVEVIMEPTTPPTFGGNMFIGSTALTSIYVPDASVEAYKAASGWSTFASKIKPISERPVGGVILNQFNGWSAATERVAA